MNRTVFLTLAGSETVSSVVVTVEKLELQGCGKIDIQFPRENAMFSVREYGSLRFSDSLVML
jgi:hypothetical protein